MKWLTMSVCLLFCLPSLGSPPSFLVDVPCPICNATFSASSGGDGSGYQTTQRLDLKPLGAIAAAYPKPVCPKCSFVLFNGARGESIPKADLDACRKIVAADAYKKHAGRSSHFLMGILFEELKRDEWAVAYVFLQASWQEESDVAKLKEDLERSQSHVRKYLTSKKVQDKNWVTAQLLCGEISRRLGRFDEARKHFDGLKAREPFQGNLYGQIIDFQLGLIAGKDDAANHTIAEVKGEK